MKKKTIQKKDSNSNIKKNATEIQRSFPIFIKYLWSLDKNKEYYLLNNYFEKFFLKKISTIKFYDIKNYMRLFLSRDFIDYKINDPVMEQIELRVQADLKQISFPLTQKMKGKRFTLNWKKINFDFENFLFWILFSKLPDTWVSDDKYGIFLEFFTIQKLLLILITTDVRDKVVLRVYYHILSANLVTLQKKIHKLCYYQT